MAYLLTESGNFLTTEAGDRLLIEPVELEPDHLPFVVVSYDASGYTEFAFPGSTVKPGFANLNLRIQGNQTVTLPEGGGGAGAVSSVFGRTGAVVAAIGDYTAANVTNALDSTQSYANPAWLTSLAWAKITGAPATEFPLTFSASLARNVNDITLDNDQDTPGNNKVYGTDGTGAKGWRTELGAVTSVFGRMGVVVAQTGDYSFAQLSGVASQAQGGVPAGGTLGQVLHKNSATNYDYSWADLAGGATDLVYNGDFPTNTPYTDGDIVISGDVAYMCVRPTSAAPTAWAGGVSGGSGLPTGGTAGQMLSKNSGTNYDASWKQGVAVQSAGFTPTGVIGTTPKMLGINFTITPTVTGRILAIYTGNTRVNPSAVTVEAQTTLWYGTGTPPTNGAAATGTQIGATVTRAVSANYANEATPGSIAGIFLGVVGTTYWIDLALNSTNAANTAQIANASLVAIEF
jgi:hypothetical protein